METFEDRRQEVRCAAEGIIRMSYGGFVIEGELGDISAGGILGNFKTANGYPRLLETVTVEAQLDGVRVDGLEGLVIRLQAGEAVRDSESVKVAIKFDNMVPDKITELRSFVLSFQRLKKAAASE